jgi:hypothetical protein
MKQAKSLVLAIGAGIMMSTALPSLAVAQSAVEGKVYALLPNSTEIWSLWFAPGLEKAF